MATFETIAKQREELLGRGFTALPGALPPALLKRWRGLAEQLEINAMASHHKGERLDGACIVSDPVGDRLMRYDDIHAVNADAVLDLLSCPGMMAVFRELCGRNAVPMQFDIVYKHQHPHPVILWHQGAQHPRGYPYLNVGIYLDDAGPGDGCLRYVPETQHDKQDIQGLSEKYGWEIPGVVEFPARAGDILIQDMMILHGSQPKRSSGVRRTIYVEIRPVEGIVETGDQSKEWAELRSRFMALVLRRADPADWPKEWISDIPTDLGSDEEEIAAIVARKEPPTPAFYARFPVESENYPVAADIKGWGEQQIG